MNVYEQALELENTPLQRRRLKLMLKYNDARQAALADGCSVKTMQKVIYGALKQHDLTVPKTCPGCQKEFNPNNGYQKYCQNPCKGSNAWRNKTAIEDQLSNQVPYPEIARNEWTRKGLRFLAA